MSKSPETTIYEFFKAAADGAADGSILKDADVHPTVYKRIAEPKTIRVGNSKFDLAPVGEAAKDFDIDITLQILAKVEDEEDAETYPPALDTVHALGIEAATRMTTDASLGGLCCDLICLRAFRGWTRIEGAVYAVTLLPVRINPTGKYE